MFYRKQRCALFSPFFGASRPKGCHWLSPFNGTVLKLAGQAAFPNPEHLCQVTPEVFLACPLSGPLSIFWYLVKTLQQGKEFVQSCSKFYFLTISELTQLDVVVEDLFFPWNRRLLKTLLLAWKLYFQLLKLAKRIKDEENANFRNAQEVSYRSLSLGGCCKLKQGCFPSRAPSAGTSVTTGPARPREVLRFPNQWVVRCACVF